MNQSNLEFGPADYAGAAFSLPALSLVLAILVAGGILLVTSRPSATREAVRPSALLADSVRTRYRPELRSLRFAALAVIVLFLIESVLRGYVWQSPDAVSWWRFATPLAAALIGLLVTLALIAARGTTPPEAPALPTGRRTWLSFSSRTGIASAGTVLLLLTVTTVLAGLASAPDSRGRYVWLEIGIPNEPDIDPLRLQFFGWAYGMPVLVALAATTIVVCAVLDRNAARSFIRPETIPAERSARRAVASAATHIFAGAMLLALAGAWRLIAQAGSSVSVTIDGENSGEPYEVVWRYAELADVLRWGAPVLEILAFTLLIVVLVRPQRTAAARPAAAAPAEMREASL